MAAATSTTENRRVTEVVPVNDARTKNYYFTVSSKLRVVEPDRRMRRPGGIRLTVVYDTSSEPVVETKLDPRRAEGWNGLSGNVVSGADFLLFRADGVLELDGRFTISATDGTLIDASYRGLVDLYEESKQREESERRELSARLGRPRHVVALPSHVVTLGLNGMLTGIKERARTLLKEIGNASIAAALGARSMSESIRLAGERYKSAPGFHGDELRRQTIEQFDRLVASIGTTTEVRHDEMRILERVAGAIARSLPGDAVRVREEAERAAAEGNLLGVLDPLSWGDSEHERYVFAESVAALRNCEAIRRLGEAIGHAFPHSGDRLVAHELGKAITNAYRSEEFLLHEEVINRSSIAGRSSTQVTMPISFEAASGPWPEAPGEDMSWVGDRFRFNESRFYQYRELTRGPFVARGTLTFADPGTSGRPPLPKEIKLDVFDLRSSYSVFDLTAVI